MKRQRISQPIGANNDEFGAMLDSTRLNAAEEDGDHQLSGAAIPMRSAAGFRGGGSSGGLGTAAGANHHNHHQRLRNVLEAQVQDGDTLQAIAIRYRCSVADIKRLNKIERDYEIHAHKTLQVPLTADNILADHLGPVSQVVGASTSEQQQQATTDQLLAALASQTESGSSIPALLAASAEPSINDIILNTKIEPNQYSDNAAGDDLQFDDKDPSEQMLLIADVDDDVPQPRSIPTGHRVHDFSCNGSDCDMSWICLFVFILALCFAIPLIYVIYIAEHHVDTEDGVVGAAASAVQHHVEAAQHET